MNQDAIAEKVRKLLRLSKSANEHEAALALEQAFRLAAKHKIDLEALALDPEIEPIIHRRFPCGQRLSYVARMALNVCTRYFHVRVVISKPHAVFVGTESDVAIANYVLGFVLSTCNRCLFRFAKAARRKPSLNQRRNFVAGFFYGLHTHLSESKNLQALEDSKFALALAREDRRLDDYKEQLFPNAIRQAIPKLRRNESALMQGFREGEKAIIHKPLNGGQPVLRLK